MIAIVFFTVILGLIVGSFLNVIIYRYPKMLKAEWTSQAHDILDMEYQAAVNTFNLMKPSSHCPECNTPIKPYQNIPLFSYLFLKGRCAHCQATISIRYPLIEILSALLALLALIQFGPTWTGFAASIFSWGLLVIGFIDFDEHFIPDAITLSLLWVGILANTFYQFTTPQSAVIGAIAGYLIFWGIAKLFKLIRKKEGLGYGDFKLLAMLGAWLGVTALLNIILLSSVLGIIYGLFLRLKHKLQPDEEIPFGPFLALAGWCTMLFGTFITSAIVHGIQ